MSDENSKSNREVDSPYGAAQLYPAIQAGIGRELQARYEPPLDVPHSLLTLLIQLKGRTDRRTNKRQR